MIAEPRIEDAPVDEATRFAESRAAKTCSRIVFALVMVYTLPVIHAFLVKTPQFEKFFMEMGTDLPGLTIFLLRISPVAVSLVFLAAIGSAVKERVVTNRRTTLIVNGVHLVALVAAKELVDIVLFMPLTRSTVSIG